MPFRFSPADRALVAGQWAGVVGAGSGCGWMAWLATSSPAAAIGAGGAAAIWAAGGVVCGWIAGERFARRVNAEVAAARARYRAEQSQPAEVPGPVGGDLTAPVEAAAGPAGGKAAAGGRLLEELPPDAEVAVADSREAAARVVPLVIDPTDPRWLPAVQRLGLRVVPLVIDPTDPRWLSAVQRLALALACEITPEDLRGQEGRGVFELARLAGRDAPELHEETIVAFTGDFVMVRAGQQPTSGRDWRGALAIAALLTGPEDPRWEPAVRRLAEALLDEIRPEDGRSIGARGIRVLAEAVWPRVPELPLRVVQDFVRDYINVRNGDRQDGNWHGLLAGLSAQWRDALLVDLVGAGGPGGISLAALVERVDRLGGSDANGTTWVFPAVGGLINRRALMFSGVKYKLRSGDDASGPIVGPGDSRWAPAVRRLVEALAAELRPEDSVPLAGRGASQIAEAVAARVPELDTATAVAFVRDYLEVRSGYSPKSGRPWREALAVLPEVPVAGMGVLAMLVADVVRVAGREGISAGAVAERLAELGLGEPDEVDTALAALGEAGAMTCTNYRWRVAQLDRSAR